MELKGRLGLIADKVPVCSIVSDIGTDHAYIPIYLVQKKVCERAIACDIKKGPIMAAEENIRHYGLERFIEARMGSGLDPVRGSEADTIVIAGMGGIMIKDIILDGIEKSKKAKALILQPMNAVEILREWLYNNGFDIYDEEMADEGEKIYNVICCKWDGKVRQTRRINHYIGEKLIEKKDPLLKRYLEKKLKQLDKVISQLSVGESIEKEIENKYYWMRDEMLKIYCSLP